MGFIPPHGGYESLASYIETRSAEVVANILICVIHHANFLLDQQKRALEQAFLREGGLRERMTNARGWPRGREIHRGLSVLPQNASYFLVGI